MSPLNQDLAEAAHALGVIAYQSGRLAEAIEHVRRAATIDGAVARYQANLCDLCRSAGLLDEAIAAGRRATALDPRNALAYNNLGVVFYETKAYEEALACYDFALGLVQDFVEAHNNRGNALFALKRRTEARAAYERALSLRPRYANAWNNLGNCLRELNSLTEAEAAFRTSLALRPSDPSTLDNLSLVVKALDRLDEAVDLLHEAIVIDPKNHMLHVHLGSMLLDQQRDDEAAVAAERAFGLNRKCGAVFNLMGSVAFARGDAEAALVHYREALSHDAYSAPICNNMGNALKTVGRAEDAARAYTEAIRLDPRDAGAHLNLADSKTFTPDDPQLAALETLLADATTLSTVERIHIEFALGKAYSDLEDYDRSFEHFRSGNAAKRKTIAYDEAATFALFDRIETVFSAAMPTAKSIVRESSPMPIFIVGMPRSGTTLIEQIIASHPMVYGAGELPTLDHVIQRVSRRDGILHPFPHVVPAMEPSDFTAVGAHYVDAVRRLLPESAQGVARFTDKLLTNYIYAGMIHMALPNANIIHTVRDPIDACISCFSKLFSGEQKFTYDLGELGRYHGRYRRLMAHWHRVLPAGRILDVEYEQVVADVETAARRIIAHCQLPWDDRCLKFYAHERPIRTASASQVRQPIFRHAVGRWRVYEKSIGELLDALGVTQM